VKIRKGFVSNSSSSSFAIIGAEYIESDFKKLVRPLFSDSEWDENNLYEIFTEKVPKKTDLDVIYDPEGEYVIIGKVPTVTEKERQEITNKIKEKIDSKITIDKVYLEIDEIRC